MPRLLLVLLCLVTGNAAAEERKYAAMSLLCDQIEVVFAQMQTGSRVARNVHEKVPLPDATFDKASCPDSASTWTRPRPPGAPTRWNAASASSRRMRTSGSPWST